MLALHRECRPTLSYKCKTESFHQVNDDVYRYVNYTFFIGSTVPSLT